MEGSYIALDATPERGAGRFSYDAQNCDVYCVDIDVTASLNDVVRIKELHIDCFGNDTDTQVVLIPDDTQWITTTTTTTTTTTGSGSTSSTLNTGIVTDVSGTEDDSGAIQLRSNVVVLTYLLIALSLWINA
eukprot:TRINITY_DN10213_c0_g1_i1.p1 TRINITY_DN10213_c0_g1~~TRINITY_DN10213_c0_g1_i1.p1  ORF type:complete len:132 (-),score=29.92 TRINITY_DN10213_c0_g1_i1:51-446(-)